MNPKLKWGYSIKPKKSFGFIFRLCFLTWVFNHHFGFYYLRLFNYFGKLISIILSINISVLLYFTQALFYCLEIVTLAERLNKVNLTIFKDKSFCCGDLLNGRIELLKLPDRNGASHPDQFALHAVIRHFPIVIGTGYLKVHTALDSCRMTNSVLVLIGKREQLGSGSLGTGIGYGQTGFLLPNWYTTSMDLNINKE